MYRKLEQFVLLLMYYILNSSRFVFPGPIFMIEKASPTNSTLAVHLQLGLKESGSCKYLEIRPDLSTIFTQLTENIFELHQISMSIRFFSCKNYFQ